MLRVISIILFIAGIITFSIGKALPKYTDQAEFERKYMELPNDSEAYWNLREQYLTKAFQIEDYGLTMASIGICLMLSVTVLKRSPKSKALILLTALFSSGIVVISSVGSLFQDFNRGEFPHWADSLGIPLAGMPVIGVALAVWGGLHCLFLKGEFATSIDLWKLPFRRWNIWLGFVILATFLILLLSVLDGYFWYIIPAFSWIYFYQSLNVGRENRIAEQDAVANP